MVYLSSSKNIGTDYPKGVADCLNKALSNCGDRKKVLILGAGASVSLGIRHWEDIRSELIQQDNDLKAFFDTLSTNNVEEILCGLQFSQLVSKSQKCHGCSFHLQQESQRIKNAFIKALTKLHHKSPLDLNRNSNHTKFSSFLQQFDHIFTLCYDLSLYWIIASQLKNKFTDGFYSNNNNSFKLNATLLKVRFLHGGLHIFHDKDTNEVRKIIQKGNESLLDIIKNNLDQDIYPVIVAEGDSVSKLKQINNNIYLLRCYEDLQNLCPGSLVITYGVSFLKDKHIVRAIEKTFKSPDKNGKHTEVWIGCHKGNKTPKENFTRHLSNETALETIQDYPSFPLSYNW